ncbi:sulfatase-like hydrolase/transferase [Pareuzebyella sediminis]|uniref:sulfatase-like hydrolase/transferase n=1 Tax=Pareuzebyella sediminis TaxID=2607998 RepID=UPI0018E10E4F|nr:sulfatase-like hydrolase/transferase [Pareuzebyella sediminis]
MILQNMKQHMQGPLTLAYNWLPETKILLVGFAWIATFFLGLEDVRSQSEGKSKPNILFIFTDDLGYGDIGVLYQNERKKRDDRSKPWTSTPHLDAMAREGAILTNHYAAAPVCAPSRASLLSGLSQGHANVRNNQFDKAIANNHTLGNVLQKAGYATSAIGKWGLQGDKRWSRNDGAWIGRPTLRGFDYFYGYMRHVDGHEHYPVEGLYRGKKEVWENEKEVSDGLDKSYTGDLWTAAAKKWITNQVQNDPKPFFMFLAYDTPHAVLELPTQAYPEGGGLKGGVQWNGKKGHMINTASGVPDSYIHPDYANATYDHDRNETTPEIPWPDTYKRYATSVRRIDDAVGDLLQLLKDLDIDEQTMVVFSSDNGPSKESYLPDPYVPNTPDFFDSFGPFDGIKRDVLEGGVRVPLLIRWPEHIPPNSKVNTPSISYDWLPTFAEAAGLPAPANSDGVTLLPALTGKGVQEKGLVYVEYFQNGKTPEYKEFSQKNRARSRKQMQLIRTGNLLGLRYDITSADDDFEIYDILNDTHQMRDLGTQSAMDSLQRWMKERVLQVRRSDTSAVRPYDDELIPASRVEVVSEGLEWKTYQGDYPWLPKLNALEPVEKGFFSAYENFAFHTKPQNLFLIRGYLKVPEDGEYTFTFRTNEKAFLRLHDLILFDADYGYKSNQILKSQVKLKKGLHPIRLILQNKNHLEKPFKLEWEGPNLTKGSIPASAFYH